MAEGSVMSVTIVKNNIATPQYARAIEAAVRRAMPDAVGHWKVWIEESQGSVAWMITIEGPDAFHWQYEFFGQEQTPEFIEGKAREQVTRHWLK